MQRKRATAEQWAAVLVSQELGRPVEVHDDGSSPSMYDLRVGPMHAPEMAIECVGAIDPVRTETWNVGFAHGEPLRLSLRGDWGVTVLPNVRLKGLDSQILMLLSALEELGVENLHADYYLHRAAPDLDDICEAAGILGATRVRKVGSGEVYLWMEGIGGAVNSSGTGVAEWIDEFLSSPTCEDVIDKLHRSGAKDREVFIAVSFGGAPWLVDSYLSSDTDDLPPSEPQLLDYVTGVWLVGGAKCVRFTRSRGWSYVRTGDVV